MATFRYTMPVRFSDIDHAGIVYFARFFHFAHLALEEFFLFRVGGRAYADLLDKERVGFPAVETGCRFSAPLRFGDLAEVDLTIVKLGRSSIQFRFRVYRIGSSAGGEAIPARSRMVDERAAEAGEGEAPASTGDGASDGAPDGLGARVLCAEGRYVVAVVDLDRFRAIEIPASLRSIIAPLVNDGEETVPDRALEDQ